VIAVDRLVPADCRILEAIGFLLVGEQFDILVQRSLIAFERKDVIGLSGDDFLGDVSLTAHRVASRHVCSANALKARCVLAEVR
jgi:hypothetical protein